MKKVGSVQRLFATLLVGVMLVPLGCSFSASSKSSSESSASSSRSSSPESKETQYRNDVRDFTAAYLRSGGRQDEFRRRIGDLAKEHGITNWEESLVTYEGIGRGLGKAQASPVEVDMYSANLTNGDTRKAKAIKEGYEAEKG